MLKHGILGLLNYGDMTGYEIMEVFRDSLGYFWSAQTSQIYRELKGLEERGFVEGRHVPQASRPDKRVYSITGAGREELLVWLQDDLVPEPRVGLLMRTFFMGELQADEAVGKFQTLRKDAERFEASLERPSGDVAVYAGRVPDEEKSLFWSMTVDYGRRYARMLEEWSDACIALLDGRQNAQSETEGGL